MGKNKTAKPDEADQLIIDSWRAMGWRIPIPELRGEALNDLLNDLAEVRKNSQDLFSRKMRTVRRE